MGQESSFRGATDRSIPEVVSRIRPRLSTISRGNVERKNFKVQYPRYCVSWNQNPLFPPPDRPIPRRYREGGSRAEIPKCVFLFWKKITRGIYKLWGSKFRGNKKIIQETSRNYFSRFFENSKNFHSHSRCTINKFYSTPLEISLGQIFFHARVNISPDIFTAMADFYV